MAYDDVLLDRLDVRGRRFLDVGCATGRLTERLAAAGVEVIAVDISEPMLEQARLRLNDRAGIKLLRWNLETAPLPGGVRQRSLRLAPLDAPPLKGRIVETAGRGLKSGRPLTNQ